MRCRMLSSSLNFGGSSVSGSRRGRNPFSTPTWFFFSVGEHDRDHLF